MLLAVAQGEIDAAVVGLGAQPLPPGIGAREVATEPLVVCVHREHAFGGRESIALADLREEPLLTLPHGSGLRTLVFNACRELGFVPRVVGETAELGALVELASVGLGVAIVPRSAAAGATTLRLTRPELLRRTALAWNREGVSPAGRAFLALARERFG
jgi:DNA-binding transcriptional LysR family regulator